MLSRLCRCAVVLFCWTAFAAAGTKPVPNLKFKDLSGQTQQLRSLQGSITVVNFWATWCGPCREELPRLSALNAEYSPRGVRFIAISADEAKDRAKIAPLLREDKIALHVWVGADLDTLSRLKLGDVLPATLILDKDGQVVGRIFGEAQPADLRGYLDWLLGGRTGPAPPPSLKRY